MEQHDNSMEKSLGEISIDSDISNIFGSNESVKIKEFDFHNKIIQNIFLLWLQYKMPMKAFNELLKIIKEIPSIDGELRDSLSANFDQYLNHALESNEVVFYRQCKLCSGYQGSEIRERKEDLMCQKCQISLENNNFFVYIGMKSQLVKMLNIHLDDILAYRNEVIDKQVNSPDELGDVWDGNILKQLVNKHEEEILLSLSLNTDGASIFQSNNTSIWPIQLYQNNLRPGVRFKNDNILVVGLHVGTSPPDMDAYFYPFITELLALEKEKIKLSRDGFNYTFKTVVTHCIVDLQAKPKLQCIKLYNSKCACTYCLHEGKSVMNKIKGSTIRYLYEHVPSEYRNHDDTVAAMLKANEKHPINGVKKLSCLTRLNNFDIIFSFSIDYMHQILLGVVRLLMTCWFSTNNSKERFYVNGQGQQIINNRLKKIKSFRSSTNPRSINDFNKFKAKEFRNFLLFYISTCFEGVLPRDIMDHFKLLSSAIYILLKTKITREDLNIARDKLNLFVKNFEQIYSKFRVTMNVHLILHIPLMVENSGPLWCQSAFFFESNNGELVKCIKGPTDILPQITKKYVLKQRWNKHEKCASTHETKNNLMLSEPLGKDCDQSEIDALKIDFNLPSFTKFYKKFKIGKSVYTCSYYTRAKRTCNYFVHLNDGSIGTIKFFMEQNGQGFAFIQMFSVRCKTDQILKVNAVADHIICSVRDIEFKYMYIDVGENSKYAIAPPNTIEIF
jgi:hypothetical protein